MRSLVAALALALACVLPAAAQNTTPRFGAPYSNNDSVNRALDRFDQAPLGAVPIMLTYCSQGANAGTFFMASGAAPSLISALNYSVVLADATCDARGNATEATADLVISAQNAVEVLGMCCQVETTPGASTTFTMRAGEANLSQDLSCSIAAGGPVTCCAAIPRLPLPVIQANVPAAVRNVNTTNESAVGALCRVFVQPTAF